MKSRPPDTVQAARDALFFIGRHGRSSANEKKIYRSWSNGPDAQLSDEGRQDAREEGDFLKPYGIRLIVADSLDRTQETVEGIQAVIGNVEVEYMRELHPLDVGDYTLQSKDEHPLDEFLANPGKVIPGGESLARFNKRQAEVFKLIVPIAQRMPGKVLVLAHGSNISFLHNHVFGTGEARVGYEGLVDPGGIIAVSPDGMTPLLKARDEGAGGKRYDAKTAGYMELAGAEKDADCKIVQVEGGVSKALGCCNEFKPESVDTKRFTCGTCRFLTEPK